MKRLKEKRIMFMLAVINLLLFSHAVLAVAEIPGISGPSFTLTAKAGTITVDDGSVIHMWGFANGTGAMQYPGPNLIVTQEQAVTVTLNNQLTVPVSIVFPGQVVTAVGGTPGLLTNEAAPGGIVTYSFTASQPGTYIYYSGTQPELQMEMGLVGALIIRPFGAPKQAYADVATAFDREYLFLLSDMDHLIHQKVQQGKFNEIDNTKAHPVFWFINGRAGLDTVVANFDPIFPNQPYRALALMHPGEKVLVRMIGAGRDLHPYHIHGNHHRVIAKDGRLLKSGATDLSEGAFTTTVGPGQTFDAIFTWTGENLGWDIYGHTDPGGLGRTGAACPAPLQPGEFVDDHCKPLPVVLPDNKDMFFGPLYTGSPFLGGAGTLPPGEGGFNPFNGFPFMWHSHSEKELTSNNIFPGGMLTWMLIAPPGTLPTE
jgi:hypothetical protein